MSYSLHMGDCLDLMPQIPSGSVDMILADLPYGTTACKWDTIIPLVPLWAEYKRIIKRNGAIVLTASQPFTSALVMSNPEWFRHRWVWDKVIGPTGHLDAKRRPMRRVEDVTIFARRNDYTYNPQMGIGKAVSHTAHGIHAVGIFGKNHIVSSANVTTRYPVDLLPFPKVQTRVGRLHPTQKPVALMEYLIRTYTNEGETVLDNVMGSGTTGVACANTGRQFIGIERDAGYFEIARKRIEAAYSQVRQLEMEVSA